MGERIRITLALILTAIVAGCDENQRLAEQAARNTEIQAKARRQGATLEQVGVNHYPRVAGTATGGNWRVIARAMKETLVLWWRMHFYEPPVNSREPRGPYVVGDAVVATGSLVGMGILRRTWRRLTRRSR